MNIISTIILGIALSMDAFSMMISISSFGTSKKNINHLIIMIGLFHFIFPIIGSFMISTANIPFDKIRILAFLFVYSQMLLEYKSDNHEVYLDNFLNYIILAISVSIDSLTIGLCYAFNNKIIIMGLIFSVIVIFFSILGSKLGIFFEQKYNKIAKLLGIIIMLILVICQVMST